MKTETIKLIRRNATRQIEEIFNSAQTATVYSEWNQYKGESCPVTVVKEDYLKDKDNQLYDDGDSWRVHINSRLWYEMAKPIMGVV